MQELSMSPSRGADASHYGVPQNRALIKILHAFHDEGIDEGPKLAKVIRDTEQFKAYGGVTGKIIKHFLTTEALEGTDLVVEEVNATIAEGAQYSDKMRMAFPSVPVKSNSFRWVLGEAALAPLTEHAESTELREVKEAPAKRTFTIKKYGGKARITGEMIDDSLFPMVERELRNLGVRAGITYSDIMLQTLLENAGSEHDTAGSNQDGAALLATIAKLRGEPSYIPTHGILHPEFMTKLVADTDIVNAANLNVANQVIDPVSGNTINKLFGIQLIEFDYPTVSSTYTWGFATGGEIGLVVVSAPVAGGYAINRELRIEDYKDPVRDLVGLVGTIRFDAQYLHADAIARMEY